MNWFLQLLRRFVGSITKTVSPVISSFTASASGTQIVLAWSVRDAQSPVTATLTSTAGTVTIAASSYTVTGLTPGQLYSFSLTVRDARNLTSVPATASATVPEVVTDPPSAGALEATGTGTRYDVGPGKAHTELTTIPWPTLTPGSVVNIYARPTPYRTKFALRAQGTPANPVILNGVADAAGNLPVLSGDGAVTATANLNSSQFGGGIENYALILIRRNTTTDAYGYKAKYLTIQNLEIRATYGKSFVNAAGVATAWNASCAGIWADVVENLVIDNCTITDHAFGVFVNNRNANGLVDAETSANVTLKRSRVYGNGRVGSYLEHNLYLQCKGYCIVEDNFLGTLRAGALGSTYKDRSANSQIRRNRIEGSARALDLVHDESGSNTTRDSPTSTDPNYDRAVVERNLIITNGSISAIHFGGDNLGEGIGPFPTYRNGPLTFKDNTCILSSNDYRAYVFDLQHVAGRVEASGNIAYFAGGSSVRSWLRQFGTVTLTGANWANVNADARDGAIAGQYSVVKTVAPIIGADPQLDSNYKPVAGSPAVGLGY